MIKVYLVEVDMIEMVIDVYILDKFDLRYIIDNGCEKLGCFVVYMLDIIKGFDWWVDVIMIMGSIEIVV